MSTPYSTYAFSGKAGTAKIGASTPAAPRDVLEWGYDPEVGVGEFCSSSTAGANAAVALVEKGSGKIMIQAQSNGSAPCNRGDTVLLALYADAGSVNYWSMTALIGKETHACKINGGEIVGIEYAFTQSGPATPHGCFAGPTYGSSSSGA